MYTVTSRGMCAGIKSNSSVAFVMDERLARKKHILRTIKLEVGSKVFDLTNKNDREDFVKEPQKLKAYIISDFSEEVDFFKRNKIVEFPRKSTGNKLPSREVLRTAQVVAAIVGA